MIIWCLAVVCVYVPARAGPHADPGRRACVRCPGARGMQRWLGLAGTPAWTPQGTDTMHAGFASKGGITEPGGPEVSEHRNIDLGDDCSKRPASQQDHRGLGDPMTCSSKKQLNHAL